MYPHERSLVEKMKDKPFALVGVNSDDKARLQKAIKNEKMTWRSWWDGGDTSGPIASKWKIEGWPTVYLIDQKGVIRAKYVGVDEKELDKALDGLIKEAEKK